MAAMTLTQVWGSILIFVLCPLLGGIPLISWITYALTGKRLSQVGTGNVSVSAAFYHGGKFVGILAVLSEALKGIAAVFLARYFFPNDLVWELVALIALVMGRYWMGRGAGTTNVVWGIVAHDPVAAGLIFLMSGVSFTIFRQRDTGKIVALFLLALILTLRNPQNLEYISAAIALAGLIFWIYSKVPDDLDLSAKQGKSDSQAVFRFFQGNKTVLSLDSSLESGKVGGKAATLSHLKGQGFPVPEGWVLPAGDDFTPLVQSLSPSKDNPLVVRSSAIGEDSDIASAAGQYKTIVNVKSREELEAAIFNCLASYHRPEARQYRRDRQQENTAMAVLVQRQIAGVFSGVAFSRDPMQEAQGAVMIEALPGAASQVVSGQYTPQSYQVYVPESNYAEISPQDLKVEGKGEIPDAIIREVALLTRRIEDHYHGIPQDIEWTYDGQQVWLLQSRPITTLQPIWTRKIAAEVIPGAIRPLTWSINRPLTCGVWGEIFMVVLGKRAKNLEFNQTATLHYSHAYFNATLLGEIFRRMGLPPESLEFLTRGAKFSKPPLSSTLRNLPGLLRLLGQEWRLEKDFYREYAREFEPLLMQLAQESPADLSAEQLLERIHAILAGLRQVTYYSILAPLSLSFRQAVLQVEETLDNSQTPEVSALRSLAQLAYKTRHLVPTEQLSEYSCPSLFATLAEMPDGESVLEQFNQWLQEYGYLSEVATDIAVPRWKEDPRPVRELFAQCLFSDQRRAQLEQYQDTSESAGWLTQWVQKRLNLKGKVTEVYSRLLADLRWSFVAIEKQWLSSGVLAEAGDIFFLQFSEIKKIVAGDEVLQSQYRERISERRSHLHQDKQLLQVPYVVYGNPPRSAFNAISSIPSSKRLQGLGASPGQLIGRIKVLRTLQGIADINEQTIIVVPYTDSGWSPVLSQAGGIISEVGGRLSHGAIVAREYGIPAVMDIPNATQIFQEGQQVSLDGQTGVIEILE